MESMNNKNIFFLILNNIIKSKSATKMNWFDMKNILWTDFTRILFWGKKAKCNFTQKIFIYLLGKPIKENRALQIYLIS